MVSKKNGCPSGPRELPSVCLKTKKITFDDRLQQVRIIEKTSSGYDGRMHFLNYQDDNGFRLLKKYRPNDWIHVINL
jgi:hypothetical protein